MKTKLLMLIFCGVFSLNAQTTHNLDWFAGIGSNVDLTIVNGDTVIWTWTSSNHTVENDPAGTSVEAFDSGFLGPTGSTFEWTFTVDGTNDYYCSIHNAASMSGTITVTPVLSIEEERLTTFSMSPNPVTSEITINLPNTSNATQVDIFDILGKQILTKNYQTTSSIRLNVSNWTSGLYIIKVASGKQLQTKRFVKL